MESISKMIKAVLMIVLFVISTSIPQAAAQETCVSPPSGMVAWWPGDGDATDFIGGNDGTLVNGAGFATGKVGQSFSFDGINDQVSVGVPNFETPNTGFSVDAWIAPNKLPTSGGIFFEVQTIVHRETNLNSRTWYFGLDKAGIRFVLFLTAPSGGRVDVIAPSVMSAGVFQHVAAVYDGGTVRLYHNGVLVKSQSVGSANFNTGDTINLGREDLGFSGTYVPFDGLIDEVELFNRALSAAEIAAIYNAGSAGKCKVTTVDIDIKPGSDPNSINPRSKGVIPVAILTTETFDATTVDSLSVAFGPNAAMETHGQGHIEDADGDGDLDLVLHFRTQDTGIQCGDTTASLTGETLSGQTINGSDSINTVGCK